LSTLKKLAGQTAIYGLSSIFARAINFLLVPFYTKLMLPSDFGILSEYMIYIAFLNVILTFGMETSYFRYCQNEKESKVFSNLFTSVFVWSSAICVLIFLFPNLFVSLLKESGNETYLRLVAVILFLDAVFAISFARLRNQNLSAKFAIFKISSILINVFLNLLFIYILPKYGVQSFGVIDLKDQVACILWANVLANLLFVFFFWKDLLQLFSDIDFGFLKKVFHYAYPVMILGLAGMVNEMIDRLMLKEYLPTDFYQSIGIDKMGAIGIYSANYKFAIFITLAIQAYRYAAEPFFFKTGAEKNSKETFSKLMTIFSLILLFTATEIALFRQEIGFLILKNPVYREGLEVVPYLLLANVCVGIYYNLSAWYKLSDKTIYGTLIGIFGAVVTIVLNYFLIPVYGYMGCAIATLVCYASMMLMSYFFGQKHYPVSYQVVRILVYFGLSIFCIILSNTFLESIQFAFFYKVGVSLLLIFMIYKIEFTHFFRKSIN
jgi:O-antigen/teichoic acid export membrane protein